MKKIWKAKLRCGGDPIRVYGTDKDDAMRSAFAVYTYNGAMSFPGYSVSDIVESVELAEDQVMKGNYAQPQSEYTPDDPEWEQFGLNKVVAGGIEFDVKPHNKKAKAV